MSVRINGSALATQNRETITFTPNVGGEYGGRLQGPREQVKARMGLFIANGYAVRYECDASPIATLEFSTPSPTSNPGGPPNPNADFTDTFQILRNTVQKELLFSDHPQIQNLNTAHLKELKKVFSENCKGEVDDLIVQNFSNVSSGIGVDMVSLAAVRYFIELYQTGVRSVEVRQPVLRVTRTTNPKYDAPFNLTYVDRILSSPRMISDSGVPSNFAVPILQLATAMSRRVTVDGSGFAVRSDVLKLKFGWLKDAITSETAGTSRNQYTLEYKFGLWDLDTYGFLVT